MLLIDKSGDQTFSNKQGQYHTVTGWITSSSTYPSLHAKPAGVLNTGTGVFTAPANGYYWTSFLIRIDSGSGELRAIISGLSRVTVWRIGQGWTSFLTKKRD